jgi:23S rRNA-/tRNA-specific pseudouridylate synthase/ubiquinone/menaquinone biosynthesis C-methylase UbiE
MKPFPNHLRPEFIARNVRLVYEDQHIIVVDKPTGMVTADPARATGVDARAARPSAREGETLYDYVKKRVRAGAPIRKMRRTDDTGRRAEQPGRAWVIHRLDKEASGLLVFAKTTEAFASLKRQFQEKSAHRIYSALAEGDVGPVGSTGVRESFIAEDRGPSPERSGRGRDGAKQLAVTRYRVVGNDRGLSLLEVRLETGRKNQIRIHMQELGYPLVGDRRFGASSDPIDRLGLHAAELGFLHPDTGKPIEFLSPPPPSFFKAVGMKPPRAAELPGARAETSPARPAQNPKPAADSSWNDVAGWYDTLLEDKGSDHYEQVILPGTIDLLAPKPGMAILDVACGQGILCRRLGALGVKATGVDAAPKLIEAARARSPETPYHVGDARKLGDLNLSGFDAATCVMALSNFDPIDPALRAIAGSLRPGGAFVAVVTHPCFRVPGESHWGWDDKAQRQFRRTDAYLTPFKREIQMHPGKAAAGKQGGELATPTFHRPIGAYVESLTRAGLLVTDLCEWTSRRAATSGPRAREENRARLEIPLFLAIRAVRVPRI